MTDPDAQAAGAKRRRRIAAALGVVAVCVVAVFIGIGQENIAPERAARRSASPPSVAPDEAKPGVRKAATRRSVTHIDMSAPLPEPGTRLAPVYAELKGRADAGDAAAASRLYRDLHRCITAPAELRELLRQASEPERIPDNLSPERRARAQAIVEQNLAERPARIRKARDDAALCDGLDREQQLVLPAMRRAAELGDPDAAVCYVTGHDLWRQGALDHPEWMAEYKANALAIAENALERGNFVVASLLANAYSSDRFQDFPLERLTGIDSLESYRYKKLMALVQPDHGVSDPGLAAAARALPAKDRAAADTWAQDMFTRHFGDYVPRSTAVCEPDMTEELNAQLRASAAAAKN